MEAGDAPQEALAVAASGEWLGALPEAELPEAELPEAELRGQQLPGRREAEGWKTGRVHPLAWTYCRIPVGVRTASSRR